MTASAADSNSGLKWRDKSIRLFAQSRFFRGCTDVGDLPAGDVPEVAFAGRSNVGKSSLINALTGNKSLAKVSSTPGRTQQLNFFSVADRFYLVDMPGYGYAQASKRDAMVWQHLMLSYLRGRHCLLRLFLLVDARHGLKKTDYDFMDILDKAALSYQIVLTKFDKLNGDERKQISETVSREIAQHPAAHPEIIETSAIDRHGIELLQETIAVLAARIPNKTE
ncbi:MAG TPA: ribosome biogenesis GTP-binding protein YihA/YsxC [Alphaproteobacteria bacterium]|jgi:GTP-binding protein|nr:YihA family ribosome biogenesis GTP-binding protein [Alphaproteobacteria bacterium]HMS45634.1 ribosome biogenesis GTP-binding protein YihA/YsxC [Alphaproteobacteria bacterium]